MATAATLGGSLRSALQPCRRCCRTRRFHASAIARQRVLEKENDIDSNDHKAAAMKARANAWYLDPPSTAAPRPPSSVETSSTSSASPSPYRQPRFTTYSALSTLPTPSIELPLQPLPSTLPTRLLPLHAHLTTNPLLLPHSVSIFSTVDSHASQFTHDVASKSPLKGKRQRGKVDSGEGFRIEGADVGAAWDWIVVCEVSARGKGAVARAERDIRRWMFLNPFDRPTLPMETKLPKFPVGPADTDWSLLDLGHGVCLNVMTAEGREKWGLEDKWQRRKV